MTTPDRKPLNITTANRLCALWICSNGEEYLTSGKMIVGFRGFVFTAILIYVLFIKNTKRGRGRGRGREREREGAREGVA